MIIIPMFFPVRPDCVIRIELPDDLTVDEARRIGAFVLAVAQDDKP